MRYIAGRLAIAVPVLLVVTFLSFYLINLLPGNPAIAILGPTATPQAVTKIDRQLGLNEGLWHRYWTYLDHLVHLNFGTSYLTGQSVRTELAQRIPVTAELLILSQIIAFAVAVPLAVLAARRQGSVLDRASTAGSFGLLSIPSFALGILLIYLFAVKLRVLPASGFTHLDSSLGENLKSMVLPSVTLAAGSVALYLRVLRNDMVVTLQQDFITMARAKGLPDRRVLLRHALRPSSLTLLTVSGLNVAILIGGAVIIEQVFDLPGMGTLAVNAIEQRDYITVQAVVVVAAVGFIIINLVVDLLYGLIDPRIRTGGHGVS